MAERNWPKGINWYQSHFSGNARVYGESSPGYSQFPRFDGVPQRMHSIVPDAKLVYVVRDPIERMISDYVHEWVDGRETRPLLTALTANNGQNQYVFTSSYFMQLSRYLQFYPISNVLVVTRESLEQQRTQTLRRVFDFLDVNSNFSSPGVVRRKHESKNKREKNRIGKWMQQNIGNPYVEKLPPQIREKVKVILYFPFSRPMQRPSIPLPARERLTGYLQDDIERFRVLTGQPFTEWSM